MRNRIGKLLCFAGLFGGIALLGKESYFWITDGFSISNITSTHEAKGEWEVASLVGGEKREVELALEQEYFYLGKGHQAYAFESKDGKYVLKFLKFQPYRYNPIVEKFPLPQSLDRMRSTKLLHKEEKRDALFRSWKVAFENLKEESGVLYIHINPTKNQHGKVTLYNKSGFPYLLSLDEHVFMVQRKADLVETHIQKHIANGAIDMAKNVIDQMVDLYLAEYDRGLAEKDRYLVRNTGMCDGKPMHIDTGRLCKDESLKDPLRQRVELIWKTSILLEWLKESYPILAEHLESRLNDLALEG